MADGQGNLSRRKNTGTVPKIKYSNNAVAMHSSLDQIRTPRMANNLSPSWQVHADSSNFIQNKSRNQRNRYSAMDVGVDSAEVPSGLVNYSANGVTPASSSSTSRRNSVGSSLKCDNITRYPDRKQIEDKLSQIREYLEVTSSLMTSIRNSDEQIFDIDEKTNLLQTRNDLLDSEKKLSNLLEEIDKSEMAEAQPVQSLANADNYSENSVEYTKRAESDLDSFDNELTTMRDQQLSTLKWNQKAENRLMDARRLQEKLAASAHSSNQVNLDSQKSNKNLTLAEFDIAIKELEERAKHLNHNKAPNENQLVNPSDKLLSEMQHLQNQILTMHDANNEREQLIHVLDNRDSELRSQQAELKKKLIELQNKKDQVDQLVMQLQVMDEENQSDVAIGNIVTMKDQLSKLKDMLEVVNATNPEEAQVAANEICLRAENLQNEIAKPSHRRNDSFVENRLDNHVSNETYQKQVNKGQRNQGAKPKQRTSSINEKIALQMELEAKKRELEEIMGKHKASTSNLNHDVGGNPVNDMSWKPPIFSQDQCSDDRLSSDGDERGYAEHRDSGNNVFPQPVNSYQNYRSKRCIVDNRTEGERPSDRLHSLSQTPERNLRSLSVNRSDISRHSSRTVSNNQNQEKLQKQLELIKSLCDSVLEQNTSNIQQVRNNITPCSIYSEQQRVSCPPSPFRPTQNQLNVFQPIAEIPWGQNNLQNGAHPPDYQNWVATNTLQTQSFMLNTLNQCCQMLWLQQKEVAQLRHTVNMLQERLEAQAYNHAGNLHIPPYNQPPNNHLRVPNVPKTNQVSAACSMPNLNQCNAVSNSDMAFANNEQIPNSALLESCLNNVSDVGMHANMNSNLNQPIWNGQALNNQVAPGNRANNYWDNFRSYSRQNQLSSKNSESSIHNAASGLDRFHLDRVNPFPLTSASKTNSEHSSTNSRDNTPRKRSFKLSRHNGEAVNLSSGDQHAPPPDVLNINQNVHKTTFEQPHNSSSQSEPRFSIGDLELDLNRLLSINSQHTNLPLGDSVADEASNASAELLTEMSANGPKNKLVDELRENVYKEVASLISANEARPHFLIQLFRDLQKIESDSLRLKILQSVQNILTQSMNCALSVNSRQLREVDVPLSESAEQTSAWLRSTKQFSSDILNLRLEGDEPLLQNSHKEIVSLLEAKEEDIIGNHLLSNIKQIFLDSELFKDSVKDAVFLKHFSNVLNDVLEQYRGKRVRDIKTHLIQTIGDLLQGELSFIHLIQETIPESCTTHDRKDLVSFATNNTLYDLSANYQGPIQNGNIQNDDDLTEADQNRLGQNEMEEDEGAVGGIIESPEGEAQGQQEEISNIPVMEFPANGEGLDQVPTRLQTKIKSGTNTPTNDLLPSHRDSDPY
ncbi:pericentriolar material 1 protein-like isoform X2 [Euwallacea similis]|uniref:pericentriolar material 1 protein-like isoform X2 n=1 Tax=Euwallacea similis TaxID=1736056 RepID=UPI00344D0187